VGPVVLRTAVGDVGRGGVQADADELERGQVAVEVVPDDAVHRGVGQAPDAAVVAVQQQAVGVEGHGVVVGVDAVAVGPGGDVRPGRPAVGGLKHLVDEVAVGVDAVLRAGDEGGVGVGGADGD